MGLGYLSKLTNEHSNDYGPSGSKAGHMCTARDPEIQEQEMNDTVLTGGKESGRLKTERAEA